MNRYDVRKLCKKYLTFLIVTFTGQPFLAIRSRHPLKPLIPYSEAENPQFKVEKFTYMPETIGYETDHRHGTNIPGNLHIILIKVRK